jgi:hypothetical protein
MSDKQNLSKSQREKQKRAEKWPVGHLNLRMASITHLSVAWAQRRDELSGLCIISYDE